MIHSTSYSKRKFHYHLESISLFPLQSELCLPVVSIKLATNIGEITQKRKYVHFIIRTVPLSQLNVPQQMPLSNCLAAILFVERLAKMKMIFLPVRLSH